MNAYCKLDTLTICNKVVPICRNIAAIFNEIKVEIETPKFVIKSRLAY